MFKFGSVFSLIFCVVLVVIDGVSRSYFGLICIREKLEDIIMLQQITTRDIISRLAFCVQSALRIEIDYDLIIFVFVLTTGEKLYFISFIKRAHLVLRSMCYI